MKPKKDCAENCAFQIDQTSQNGIIPDAISNYRGDTCKISVIIPVYNTALWLPECLDSILAQDYDNLQIICINDGSTDNSLDILRAYEAKDSRIIIINQENRGLSEARNAGLKASDGKYISFVDSDDVMEAGILKAAVQRAESESLQFLQFKYDIFNDGDTFREDWQKTDYPGIFTGPELFEAQIKNEEYKFLVWRSIYLRQFLIDQHIAFTPDFLYEDHLFTFECFLFADRAGYLNQIGIHYRIRKGSLIHSEMNIKKIRSIYLTSKHMTLLCYEKRYALPNHPVFFKLPLWELNHAAECYKTNRDRIITQAETPFDRVMLKDLDQYNSVEYQEYVDEIYRSASWKVGNALIQPLHWVKERLKR